MTTTLVPICVSCGRCRSGITGDFFDETVPTCAAYPRASPNPSSTVTSTPTALRRGPRHHLDPRRRPAGRGDARPLRGPRLAPGVGRGQPGSPGRTAPALGEHVLLYAGRLRDHPLSEKDASSTWIYRFVAVLNGVFLTAAIGLGPSRSPSGPWISRLPASCRSCWLSRSCCSPSCRLWWRVGTRPPLETELLAMRGRLGLEATYERVLGRAAD